MAGEVNGSQIKGPMKWLIVMLGTHDHASDIGSLLPKSGYENLNIIVVKITSKNNQMLDLSIKDYKLMRSQSTLTQPKFIFSNKSDFNSFRK